MEKVNIILEEISSTDDSRIQMYFSFYQKYFSDCVYQKFAAELKDCKHVVSLWYTTSKEPQLLGFSGIGYLKVCVSDILCYCIWNGPTILGSEARGSRIFFRVLSSYAAHIRVKMESNAKIYFFMMSEGFQSYLFCHNNFPVFYPNPKTGTPLFETQLLHKLGALFGQEDWDAEKMVIKYEEGEGLVCEGDTLVTVSNELFNFYKQRNPRNGDYLCCVAECSDMFFAKILICTMALGNQLTQAIHLAVHAQFQCSSL